MQAARRYSAAIVVAVSCLALAAPSRAVTSPAKPAPATDAAYADPSKELGATSPSCRFALLPAQRRNCRASQPKARTGRCSGK